MNKKNTIIYWSVVAALMLIAVGVVYLVKTRPRTVPLAECSQVYRQYKDVPGINAAYVKNYHVNDTLTICATLLEAQTDSAWDTICQAFNCIYTENDKNATAEGRDVLGIQLGYNCSNSGMKPEEIGVSSLRDHYICVFHNIDSAQREHILDALLDKVFNSLRNNQKFTDNEESN